MAIIHYSGLVNAIYGRLLNIVFSKQKGTAYIKAWSTTRRDPESLRQLQIRNNFLCVTQHWETTTSAEKDLWEANRRMTRLRGHAKVAHDRANLNLLHASHADLVMIDAPPSTPSTPEHVTGWLPYPVSSTVTCITWTRPSDTQTYVTARHRLHFMFCCNFPAYGCCPALGYRRDPRFIKTQRADTSPILHNHTWPTGARLYYKLNSIDKFGRKSPVTHEEMIYVP